LVLKINYYNFQLFCFVRLESATSQSSGGKQMNGMERWGPDKMRNLDSNSSKMEVTIGEDLQDNRPVIKERPIWLTESTVVENTSTRVRTFFIFLLF